MRDKEPFKNYCQSVKYASINSSDSAQCLNTFLSVPSLIQYADETMEVPDNTHVGERGSKEVSMKVMESWESNPKPTRIKKSISFLPPDKIKLAQRKEVHVHSKLIVPVQYL